MRSLVNHIEELRVLLATSPIDVLAINETWPNSTISDNDVYLPGFTLELKRHMHERDILKIKAIRCKDIYDWAVFKKARNSVNNEIKLAISQSSRGPGLVDVWRDISRDNKL